MSCLFFLFIAIVVIVDFNSAAPGNPNGLWQQQRQSGNGKGPKLGSADAKQKLMAQCQKKENKCKGQTDEYKAKRKQIKAGLLDEIKNKNAKISDEDANKEVEQRLSKTYQLKKKVHEKFNIAEIDPADDGVWQRDIVLTVEQADAIMQSLDLPDDIDRKPGALQQQQRPQQQQWQRQQQQQQQQQRQQKRSAAKYFEDIPMSKWEMPIRYWASPAFTGPEKATIDAALEAISSAAGCIFFAKDTVQASSGSQIQFVKSGSGCSGNSPVGHIGINTIAIATQSSGFCAGGDDALKGIIIHETIHSLGGGHEQSRRDRDWYLAILFDNLDPQNAHNYAMDPLSTSYGVPYDYQSVMHYEQGLFAFTSGLDTMYPYSSSKLGSSALTSNDILQLERMYCKPNTCLDNDKYCGIWTVPLNYCNDATYGTWMKANCAKSCGLC